MVTDPADATDAALDAVEHGDRQTIADLVLASPDLLRIPFLAPYLAATVALLDNNLDTATDLIALAAGQGDETDRTAGAARLRRLGRRRPDLRAAAQTLAAALSAADRTDADSATGP